MVKRIERWRRSRYRSRISVTLARIVCPTCKLLHGRKRWNKRSNNKKTTGRKKRAVSEKGERWTTRACIRARAIRAPYYYSPGLIARKKRQKIREKDRSRVKKKIATAREREEGREVVHRSLSLRVSVRLDFMNDSLPRKRAYFP